MGDKVINHLIFLIYTAQGGIDQAAENVGLGKPIDIRLAREEMNGNGPLCLL